MEIQRNEDGTTTYKVMVDVLSKGDFEDSFPRPEEELMKDRERFEDLKRKVDSGEIERVQEVSIKFMNNPVFDSIEKPTVNKSFRAIFMDTSGLDMEELTQLDIHEWEVAINDYNDFLDDNQE